MKGCFSIDELTRVSKNDIKHIIDDAENNAKTLGGAFVELTEIHTNKLKHVGKEVKK